jgi:hypothetical protein
MSWALPLPEAAQRLIWRFKTQSPTAAIASEPLETLFARGGHIKSPCGCGAVVRVDRYFVPRYCYRCSWELFGST